MNEKYTLITGASEGIGYEFAKLFAKDGHNLIIVARNKIKLEKIKRELEKEYEIKVSVVDVDFSMDNSCEKLIKFVDKNNLIVDNLINNVGIGSFGYFHQGQDGFEDHIIDINIRTVTILTKHFLRTMINNGTGRILNMASTSAFVSGPKMAMYYATKAYVLSLTEAIHEEVKGLGVMVSCLCPGPVKTSFQEKAGINKAESAKKYLMCSDKVAEIAYKDFNNGKAIIIPGIKNKLAVIANKFAPRFLSRRVILKNNNG